MFATCISCQTRSSAIAERPRCSLFKLWQKYKREKRASGLFLKSPVATVSSTHYLGSLIMSMPASDMCHVHHVLHTVRIYRPFLSVLIGFHVIHPNTSLSSVNQHLLLIRYSIAIIAMQIEHSSHFVKTQHP